MTRHINHYQHLNEQDKFSIEINLEDVARKIIRMNYGVHRLLSAITTQRLTQRPNDELALGIKVLLEKGLY